MTVIAAQTRITPEQLEQMPDAKSYELVGGRLAEKDGSILSSRVGGNLLSLLGVAAFRTKEAQIVASVRAVTMYTGGKSSPTVLKEPDEITTKPASAEFRCKVAAFFE